VDQVGIIIPVYNEAANIGTALTRIFQEVTVPYKVYIVYDFDEDSTLGPARETARQFQKEIVLLKNQYGRGALNAIKQGSGKQRLSFLL
jgi:dolichol-phosphate mannosyltransferase